jgi:hypothetical protein
MLMPSRHFQASGSPASPSGGGRRAFRQASDVNHCFGFDGDRRLLAGARAIIQRSHRAFNHGPFNATLDRLMMQSERRAHRKNRRISPIRRGEGVFKPDQLTLGHHYLENPENHFAKKSLQEKSRAKLFSFLSIVVEHEEANGR